MYHPLITKLIQLAFEEDIGAGDITTEYCISPEIEGRGYILAKERMVIAGQEVARQVFDILEPGIRFISRCSDGDTVEAGTIIIEIRGKLRTLLTGERIALNFLQRLSGIATHVRSYVHRLGNKTVRLTDTRKTTPGWRILEKYAVRVGGAFNHRMGLSDGVLIKDNHIAVCGGIRRAVERARANIHHLMKIEVEVTNLEEVREALEAKADVIMLDNMNLEQIREAVAIIENQAVIEVSGGVTQETLLAIADTGVHLISVGALTHAARSVDVSMQIEA